MAITQGDGGTGGGSISLGGSAASICAISPTDLVGTLDNLITRIEKIEAAVTQLLTANIKANQLSDLATRVGWVGGVTYMGVDGWTQTEYGTLIPPPGVTFSSLGINIPDVGGQQLIVMDEAGALLFGAGINGVFGSLVDAWNAGAGASVDYAIVQSGSSTTRNMTVSANTLSSGGAGGGATVVCATSGLYHVHLLATIAGLNAFGGAVSHLRKNGTNIATSDVYDNGGEGGTSPEPIVTLESSRLVVLTAGDNVSCDFSFTGGGSTTTVDSTKYFEVFRISG